MPTYDNTNRGALFVNERKDHPNKPDYTGKLNVGGKDYRLAAWLKPDSGRLFCSLEVSESLPKDTPPPAPAKPAQEDFDDPIPF